MMNDNTPIEDAIIIERFFDVPASLIWQMWTADEQFKQWYGPNGMTIPTAEMDVQVGGKRLIAMEIPGNGVKMWCAGEYRDVVPNERLVYTDSMADEAGNILSPAMMGMPDQPETTIVTVELEENDGRTKMMMTHAGLPADSPGAMGWAQAFDKLAAHIANK